MNFIFISPNFPENYWLFAQGLKNNGVRVLAIADIPYTHVSINLKNAIHDFYQVHDLKNYEEMVNAVAYFTHKYGQIDWIESNNEYWLRQDARLRMDFHVQNGIPYPRIDEYQSKQKMKEFFSLANIPTARYQMLDDLAHAYAFIKRVGYPIVIKPDIGVGASQTSKITNEQELIDYFREPISESMIMEEYINGSCFSFDGITNSKKEILFVTAHQYTDSIMDAINENKNIGCYSFIQIPDDIMDAGTRTVQAFDTRSRFFHIEFFRLNKDQGIGKKGDIFGLEVNMRPPGGFLPDMINYATDSNVYQLWADMIVYDKAQSKHTCKYTSGFIGKRDELHYSHSTIEVQALYKDSILMIQRLPKAIASAMGDEVIVARFKTEKEILAFFDYVQE